MIDIQDQADLRGVAIDRVGISELRHPTSFRDGEIEQFGMGTFSIHVGLPEDRRGTHMSRMVELVADHLSVLDPRGLPVFLKEASGKLDVRSARIEASMALAIEVVSPATRRTSWQPFDILLAAEVSEDAVTTMSTVTTAVTSLCPCSKAISDYGAHNQRSVIALLVEGTGDSPYPLTVSQAFALIRRSGSSPVFPLIKRPDERAVTMAAFDKPAFVEDIVRDVSLECRAAGVPHRVEVANIESIHSHDATASLSWGITNR
ncbi:GTP cyclohydrolase [Aeromicrobium sp. A1-2]|uniref:GTP cyclohydrolase I FolE2 n=1 Tax=Aeromicrobium sp. A1-2 TaxID=2107713 RepID=UPI000E51C9DC|nr:GTP cyclohydrolase, FolE2/MptA family [Aeromicrobium sp. A1-2]AXT85121.1 GTP cyclohydrolase [Aeromicrobium sp. A1-2]